MKGFKIIDYVLVTMILLITACTTKNVIEEPTIINSLNTYEKSKSSYEFNYDNLSKGTLLLNLSVYQNGVLMEGITNEAVLSDLYNSGNIEVLIDKVLSSENKVYMQIGLSLNDMTVYKSFELFDDPLLKTRNVESRDIYEVEIGEEYNILCIYENENLVDENETSKEFELDWIIEKSTFVYILTVKHL
ncbi:hypothetical protein RJG79_07825 [Mycoplasmatota bacterium WC44]